MRELAEILTLLKDGILAQDKEERSQFLNDFKLFLLELTEKSDKHSLIASFIARYSWVSELDERLKLAVMDGMKRLLEKGDLHLQLASFEQTWDSIYFFSLNEQPEQLNDYQRQADHDFEQKKQAIHQAIRTPAKTGMPIYEGESFHMSVLPIHDDCNRSNQTFYETTTEGVVFVSPAGMQVYLDMGWQPPADYIEAVVKTHLKYYLENYRTSQNYPSALKLLFERLQGVVEHSVNGDGTLEVPGAILESSSQSFSGSGGYMSTITVTESERDKIYQNTAVAGEPVYYHEGKRRVCGFLFGIVDKRGEPFAVIDGAEGQFEIKFGTCHLARFGPIAYKGMNVTCLFTRHSPYEQVEIPPIEPVVTEHFRHTEAFDGNFCPGKFIPYIESTALSEDLRDYLNATRVSHIPRRKLAEEPFIFKLPYLGEAIPYGILTLNDNKVKALMASIRADESIVPDIEVEDIQIEFPSFVFKRLACQILFALGLLERGELESDEEESVFSLLKKYLISNNEDDFNAFKAAFERAALKAFVEGDRNPVVMSYSSIDERNRALAALKPFGFSTQDKAHRKFKAMGEKATRNCNFSGRFNPRTREVSTDYRGPIKNSVEASLLFGMSCVDLRSFGDSHLVLQFSSTQRRNEAIDLLCQLNIVKASNLRAYGDNLFVSGVINVRALYRAIAEQEGALREDIEVQAYRLYREQKRQHSVKPSFLDDEELMEVLTDRGLKANFMSTENIIEPLMLLIEGGQQEESVSLQMETKEEEDGLVISFAFNESAGLHQAFARGCVNNGLQYLNRVLSWHGVESVLENEGESLSIRLLGVNKAKLQQVFETEKLLAYLFYSWLTQAFYWVNQEISETSFASEKKLNVFSANVVTPKKIIESNLRYIVANQLLPKIIYSSDYTTEDVRMCLEMGAEPNDGVAAAVITGNVEVLALLLEKGSNLFESTKSEFELPFRKAINALNFDEQELSRHHLYRDVMPPILRLGQGVAHQRYKDIIVLYCDYADEKNLLVNDKGLVAIEGKPLREFILNELEEMTSPFDGEENENVMRRRQEKTVRVSDLMERLRNPRKPQESYQEKENKIPSPQEASSPTFFPPSPETVLNLHQSEAEDVNERDDDTLLSQDGKKRR